MYDFPPVKERIQEVLQRVYRLEITRIREDTGQALPPDGMGVAALCFQGGYSGEVVMVLRRAELARAAEYVLAAFGLPSPMPPEAIFPEMLNMCAGSLISELSYLGEEFQITPPVARWADAAFLARADRVLTYETDQGFSIILLFQLKDL